MTDSIAGSKRPAKPTSITPTSAEPVDPPSPWGPLQAAVKRTFDLVAAGGGLLVLSPVFAAVALAIKFDSRGPVFFLQQRIGRNFHPFQMYKFRTMVVDAPKLGGQLTVTGDPRVTRTGRLFRKLKIDELPQLINVIIGDMSLVGPRPEVARYVEQMRDDYREVLSVRPGITDLASVKYRDESAILATAEDPERAYINQILPDKLAISRQYIRNASLWLDLKIILQTLLRIAS